MRVSSPVRRTLAGTATVPDAVAGGAEEPKELVQDGLIDQRFSVYIVGICRFAAVGAMGKISWIWIIALADS